MYASPPYMSIAREPRKNVFSLAHVLRRPESRRMQRVEYFPSMQPGPVMETRPFLTFMR